MNNIKKILLNEANSNSELFLSLKADFSYHSSAIEGSKVTEKDNKEISKISSMISAETIATKYHDKYTHDEVIENFNCGILFEYIFKTFDEPITEKSIKI
jgi:hypothetical protein